VKQFNSLLLILICFPLFSNAQTAVRIPIGQDIENTLELPVSLIAKEILFVPLETNPNCLLDNDISRIEIFDNNIFISDYIYIFIFDLNGKFIKRIGKLGKGPGEYIKGFQTFLIDKQNKHLIIFEMINNKMMVYDFDGNFIDEKPVDFMPGPTEWVNEESFAVYNNGYIYEKEPWKDYYILNSDAEILQKNKFKKLADKRYGLMLYPVIFYRYKGITRYKNPYESIIYEIYSDKKPKPVYFIDYGKYEKYNDIDDVEIQVRNNVGINRPNPESFEKIGILDISETDDYLFFYYGHQEQRKVGIYDKKEKTFYKLFDKEFKLFGFQDDMYGGLPVFPKNGITGNMLYCHYNAYEIKKYLNKNSDLDPKLKKVVDSVDDTDNPVLMLVKLK
jgi:hypothetical protein